ncbi:MAG: dockerin type I repeat-containing protein [Ruminococcus sp.]|nr:dockerin type I repeat-containing protein [Ruminococcus sp.]
MKKKLRKIIVAVTAMVLSAISVTGMTVSADIADNSTDYVMGDVNADGKFTIADVILFQSWLMGSDVTLNNTQAVDFCEDGVLDVFDLCMMKSELINHNDSFIPCTATINDVFVDYVVVINTKQQYPERIWTAEDFKGVENIDVVLDATPPTWNGQVLYVLLKDCSKENVLKMIHEIESLNIEEICTVRPTSWEPGIE